MHNYIIKKQKTKIRNFKKEDIFGKSENETSFSLNGDVIIEYLSAIGYLLVSNIAYVKFLGRFRTYRLSEKMIKCVCNELYKFNIKNNTEIRLS